MNHTYSLSIHNLPALIKCHFLSIQSGRWREASQPHSQNPSKTATLANPCRPLRKRTHTNMLTSTYECIHTHTQMVHSTLKTPFGVVTVAFPLGPNSGLILNNSSSTVTWYKAFSITQREHGGSQQALSGGLNMTWFCIMRYHNGYTLRALI